MRQRSICTGLHIIQTLFIISIPIHALLVMGTQQFKSHLQYILLNSDSVDSTKGNYVCLSVYPFVRHHFFLLRIFSSFSFSVLLLHCQIFSSFSSSSSCQIFSSFSFYSADQIFPISKHFPSFPSPWRGIEFDQVYLSFLSRLFGLESMTFASVKNGQKYVGPILVTQLLFLFL